VTEGILATKKLKMDFPFSAFLFLYRDNMLFLDMGYEFLSSPLSLF
jgi:hypothetical protein